MYRFAPVLPALFLFAFAVAAQQQQQNSAPKSPNSPDYAAVPVQATKEPNPVKATPESLTRAKKWWAMDCAMCHGDNGNGKGDTAVDMKLNVVDFTDPNTLKDRTDGELNYIIKNGHQDMPPEGQRIKTEEGWDLVNYVRSFSKKDADTNPKDANKKEAPKQKPQ